MIQITEDDDIDVVINDEGKLNGLSVNKILIHDGMVIDILVGDLLIVGVDNKTGETKSVPDDKIDKYLQLFSKDCIEL